MEIDHTLVWFFVRTARTGVLVVKAMYGRALEDTAWQVTNCDDGGGGGTEELVVGRQTMVVGGITVLGVIARFMAVSELLDAQVPPLPELVIRLSTSGISVTEMKILLYM